jgi:hypothetical protein
MPRKARAEPRDFGGAEWRLFSDEHGVRAVSQPVERLPKAAVISGDGRWAELWGNHGLEKVFVRLGR